MRSAIMDIGYNAIRAVVYENDTLGAPEIFNSKFKSDILNLLTKNSLNIDHKTYLTIEYLLHVFKNLEVTNIRCVATAVLRNNPKANDFIKHIKSQYNFDIEIISGDQEAKLTALGLISGIPNAHGLALDLGGGSLELVEIDHGNIGDFKSFELGTKVLCLQNITDEHKIIEILQDHYSDKTYDTLYLIGGALRFIGRLYIDFIGYPLKNLHNLEISTQDLSNYLDKLLTSSQDTSNKIGRRTINHNAIFIAKAMLAVFKPSRVLVSTYGLKEGVRFTYINKKERQKNIILEKVQHNCNYDLQHTNWENYYDLIIPLLPKNVDYQEIIQLSIILRSLQHKFDRTLPPSAISEFILSLEIPFTHKMRVMLALIMSHSSNYKPSYNLIKTSKKVLSKIDNNNCQIIAHCLYIAEAIDGPIYTNPSFAIKTEKHYLEIDNTDILPRTIFERICIRLKSIAFARKMNLNLLNN